MMMAAPAMISAISARFVADCDFKSILFFFNISRLRSLLYNNSIIVILQSYAYLHSYSLHNLAGMLHDLHMGGILSLYTKGRVG